jgi:thioredoxin-like negative regulator of GroEL
MAPVIDKLVQEFEDQIDLVKVNADLDTNEDLLAEYDVRSIPTLVLLKGKQIVWAAVGQKSEAELRNLIEQGIAMSTE